MQDLVLTAYRVPGFSLKIVAASADREWMTRTDASFANRCLPLRIANQFGWFILSDQTVEAVWSGKEERSALQLHFPTGRRSESVTSHFGYGILTWHIPFLFRTSPGYNLYVRGPTNWPKDGAVPLDGIVETDWAVATFTMNWKVTCIDTPVTFRENEPICMIAPLARGQLECFVPEVRQLAENCELKLKYEAWSASRNDFLKELPKETDLGARWQKHYFKGTSPTNDDPIEHQTRIKLRQFSEPSNGKDLLEPVLLPSGDDPLRIRRKAKSLWSKIHNRLFHSR